MTIEKFQVRNRWTGEVQFTAEIDVTPDMAPSVKRGLAVKWGVKNNANFAGANLAGAHLARAVLAGANLAGAHLAGADLADASFEGAVLAGANLAGANLAGANLAGAHLAVADLADASFEGANLGYANLAGANLVGANLAGAVLAGANLGYANLVGANLAGAVLAGAHLAGAHLAGAKDADYAIAQTRILPDGDLIGWKKCRNGVIVKLRIPEASKRSHAFGRKCRAEYADVLEVIGADVGVAQHDRKTEYRAGERVTAPNWSDDWREECAGGIHFFITRLEAENYLRRKQ